MAFSDSFLMALPQVSNAAATLEQKLRRIEVLAFSVSEYWRMVW